MDEQEARQTVQTLVKKGQTRGTNALSKLSKQSSDTVADWLTLYATTFPNEELSPEQVLLYRDLANEYPAERLHRAFKAALYHSQSGRRGFMPKPGEVCEAAERDEELMPKRQESDPACKLCDGTGFRITQKEGNYKLATVCECRARKAR